MSIAIDLLPKAEIESILEKKLARHLFFVLSKLWTADVICEVFCLVISPSNFSSDLCSAERDDVTDIRIAQCDNRASWDISTFVSGSYEVTMTRRQPDTKFSLSFFECCIRVLP